MTETPEYRDLTEIRERLTELRAGLNDFTMRYARTDFRTDTKDQPDPFVLTDLIRRTDEIIELHRDISQTDIIRMLVRKLLLRTTPEERQNLCRRLQARNINLTEQQLLRQAITLSMPPETLHTLLFLIM